jgi:flagellar motor component MotA
VNRGYHFARLIAEAVRVLLMVLFVAMALEQMEVAPNIVVAAFSIIFGGIVLALAISFGVGGIEAARRIIERETEKKDEGKEDIEHI